MAALVGLGVAGQAHSANWLMLQGTENPKAPKHRMWGFVQPQYTHNVADPMTGLIGNAEPNNGKVVAQNLVGPELKSQNDFHIKRARIGWRGKLTDQIDYFTLFEGANNSLTFEPFGDRDQVIAPSDLSLTFKQIPGAKIRIGLFKNPGSEESFQGIGAFNYIEFTDFQNREILERFSTGGVNPAGSNAAPTMGVGTNTGYGFSAFRDWGLQVFDHKKFGKWDMSYAVKVGRGESISDYDDNDFHPELYVYASGEYDLPGGKGGKKHGVKLYAWHQQGERSFESDSNNEKYDRIRQGVGVKAIGKFFDLGFRHRFQAEYMQADGMIFIAPQGNVAGGNLQYAAEKGNKAEGYYFDFGFYPTKKIELGFRYDRNNLLNDVKNINVGNEREISGWTYAATYYFKPKLKLSLNYIQREAKAPVDYTATGGLNDDQANNTTNKVRNIVSNLDDKVVLQLTYSF